MYEEGYLSIWVGCSVSEATLEDYTRLQYSDDGDLIPSPLLHDFELRDSDGDFNAYEEGCQEISFFNSGKLESCLQEFSYANLFASDVIKKIGSNAVHANSVIILFNYNACTEEGKEAGSNGTRMKFIQKMKYVM